jgi:hypothetical protein
MAKETGIAVIRGSDAPRLDEAGIQNRIHLLYSSSPEEKEYLLLYD